MTAEDDVKVKVIKIQELQKQIEALQKDVNFVVRNIQQTPTGTYFVSLPKEWCSEHGLKKGYKVTISQQKDSLIIIP